MFPNCGQFKIALCQLSVTSEKTQNLGRAGNLIKVAAENGARPVVLPVSGLTYMFVKSP
jgi:omega-amidase